MFNLLPLISMCKRAQPITSAYTYINKGVIFHIHIFYKSQPHYKLFMILYLNMQVIHITHCFSQAILNVIPLAFTNGGMFSMKHIMSSTFIHTIIHFIIFNHQIKNWHQINLVLRQLWSTYIAYSNQLHIYIPLFTQFF